MEAVLSSVVPKNAGILIIGELDYSLSAFAARRCFWRSRAQRGCVLFAANGAYGSRMGAMAKVHPQSTPTPHRPPVSAQLNAVSSLVQAHKIPHTLLEYPDDQQPDFAEIEKARTPQSYRPSASPTRARDMTSRCEG